MSEEERQIAAQAIVREILAARPALPDEEVLDRITFCWNEEDLSPWDGGYDLNEQLREAVILLLEPAFESVDPGLRAILRFLLVQESMNCYEGEFLATSMRPCYDGLARLKHPEDVPLLLDALGSSFDASCGLDVDRLFMADYATTLAYLKQDVSVDSMMVENYEYRARQMGITD